MRTARAGLNAFLGLLLASAAVQANAGEAPLYQPAPAWVVPAVMPDLAALGADAPILLVFDNQHQIEKDRLWTYVETATRAATAESMAQLATLTLPWLPDKGDIIIHDVSILRGNERIDLIAAGGKFEVLRREQGLEQRLMTGMLTAAMPIEGLRLGDVLRVRYSTTSKDDALDGRVQSIAPVIAAPVRLGFGRLRASWPSNVDAKWKVHLKGVDAKPVTSGGVTRIDISMPVAKQPDMPDDAPVRFRNVPLFELVTFRDWAEVSRIMAPLYSTADTIKPGSALETELKALRAGGGTKLEQAARALRLVQDQVRYLMMGMNGGNYVPQTPEQTWSVRYGDCKAKTRLLLALLDGLGIEAEPVLVNSQLGDLVPSRVPSAAAFDHVIVRAVIDGETLWLDGTSSGTRIADIRDTPPFVHALPLRVAGAGLIAIPARAPARPTFELLTEVDESSSVDLPSVFTARAVMRGAMASQVSLSAGQIDAARQKELIASFFSQFMGEAQYSEARIETDVEAGTNTLIARGVADNGWNWTDRKMKRWATRGVYDVEFAPDRARAAWQAIPVATPPARTVRYQMKLRLPDGGKGFALEGGEEGTEALAGYRLSRNMKLEGGMLIVDERLETTGAEIAPGSIADERDKVETARALAPLLVAPKDTLRRWSVAGKDPKGGTQVAAAEAVLAKIIADDPEEATAHSTRASLLRGIGAQRQALADMDQVIALRPDEDNYLKRSGLRSAVGDDKGALADAESARSLNTASVNAVTRVAELRARTGDLKGSQTLLDQRIRIGGENKDSYKESLASVLGEYGDPNAALEQIETMLTDRPNDPELLNMRCWIKGARAVVLDGVIEQCTLAVERGRQHSPELDSRAMAYFRLGRNEEALRDLDAALNNTPGLGPSRFMRGVVLTRLGRKAEAASELAIARQLNPQVDVDYARYGIKP